MKYMFNFLTAASINSSMKRQRSLSVEQLENRRLLASQSTLLKYDFNAATVWPTTPGITSPGVSATQSQSAVGTVDAAGTSTKTGAVNFAVTTAPASGYWKSELTSGQLPLSNTVTRLDFLTLAFDLRTSQAKPVRVLVDSFSASNVRTGSLETMIYPAAANSFQRYAIDLSTMTASGTGTFDPVAPNIGFRFEVGSQAGWTQADSPSLQLDNVNYSKPAYFVRPFADGGRDTATGRSETTAFATIQKAIDVSQAGDIVLIMDGNYGGQPGYIGSFNGVQAVGWINQGGSADAWLSLKNYPGQTPTISTSWVTTISGTPTLRSAWAGIQIGTNVSAPTTGPAVAYVEVRGLRVFGNSQIGDTPSDPFYSQFNTAKLSATAIANNNGIEIDGRYEANIPHHIRIADNLVEYTSGGGINTLDGDWVTYEGNTVRNTSWWTRYATSGISLYSSLNFDTTDDGSCKRIIRDNIASGNETRELWQSVTPPRYSDGNGIIIDVNRESGSTPTIKGRTLVQNNVVFDNGGSGIHSFRGDKVDIAHNTAYLNSASPHLQYGQIFAEQAIDVKIFNNVLVAPVAGSGQPSEPVNGGTTPSASNGIEYRNNLFWGGNTTPLSNGINGNIRLDPLFVAASIDPAVADFRLQATSPAIGAATNGFTTTGTYARTYVATRYDSLDNVQNGSRDIGAFEYYVSSPTIVNAAAATSNPVVTTSTVLTVTAGDNRGPAGLTYTWSTTSKPIGASDPTFDRNGSIAARTATAMFSRAGNYTLQVAIADANGNITNSSVAVVVAVDAMPQVKVTPATITSTEGNSIQYNVVLNTQPTANVNIAISGHAGQATLSTTSLTFTPANWNVAQTVTIQLLDDYIVEGSQSITLSHAPTSTDANYQAVNTPTVAITFADGANPSLALSNGLISENLAIGTTAGTISTLNGSGSQTYSYQLVSGAGSTDNAAFAIVAGALTTTAVFDFEVKSSYAIRVRATDTLGQFFERNLTVNVANAPELISGAQINDGSIQRSQVKSISLRFDSAITFDPSAFKVQVRGNATQPVTVTATQNIQLDGSSIILLTFSGSRTRNGSLLDGNYELIVDGTQITGWIGSNYHFGAQQSDKFFAYFGDTNGDRSVGALEAGAFRAAFGKAFGQVGYNALFDYDGVTNGIGGIGAIDAGQFQLRFGKTLLF
jgi:hypothetical protein